MREIERGRTGKLIIPFVLMSVVVYAAENGGMDRCVGASCYTTSHATNVPINRTDTDYRSEDEIKEYHFHTYFFLTDTNDCPDCGDSRDAAERLRLAIVDAVKRKKFVAVCHGVDATILPGLNTSAVYPVNLKPQGPHPVGSFETWFVLGLSSLASPRRGVFFYRSFSHTFPYCYSFFYASGVRENT